MIRFLSFFFVYGVRPPYEILKVCPGRQSSSKRLITASTR